MIKDSFKNPLQKSVRTVFQTIPVKRVFYFSPKKGIYCKWLERWFFLEKFVSCS